MKIGNRLLFVSFFAACLLALASCTPQQPSINSSQANRNQSAQTNFNQQANTNVARGEIKPPSPGPGTANIEITSTPPGADIILIERSEDSDGRPQQYGLTPKTVNVPAGKYLINLEMSGYGYFQREVTLKEGETMKVNASLKKR
jgi:hypothetical protein